MGAEITLGFLALFFIGACVVVVLCLMAMRRGIEFEGETKAGPLTLRLKLGAAIREAPCEGHQISPAEGSDSTELRRR